MSEIDRVFPPRAEEADVPQAGEKRFIQASSHKRGPGPAQTRSVEVVHLRSARAKPPAEPSHRAVPRQHAAIWPDGFRARSLAPRTVFGVAPPVPEPAPPRAHVMAGWDPSPKPPAAVSSTPAVKTVADDAQQPPASRPKALKAVSRRFADPFADGDSGANCLRCGYLVERAREDLGKTTCSRCG